MGMLSYRSEAFHAKTRKRKSTLSTNFKHCQIRSNFYLKFNKHEKKLWRVLSSNLLNSGLFIRTNKYQQKDTKKRRSGRIFSSTIMAN